VYIYPPPPPFFVVDGIIIAHLRFIRENKNKKQKQNKLTSLLHN
jgi:hypothetical protein